MTIATNPVARAALVAPVVPLVGPTAATALDV